VVYSQIVDDYWEAVVSQEPRMPEASEDFIKWREKVRQDPEYFKAWQKNMAQKLGVGKKKKER